MMEKKIKIENIIVLIIILLTYVIYKVYPSLENLLFWTNIIFCLLICIKSKLSLFSLKTLLLNYVLVSAYFQQNTGESYGLLQMSLYELNYMTMNILVLIYDIIMYIFIINTNILEKEKEKFSKEYKFANISTYILCLLAIIFTIVHIPNLDFTFSTINRFQSLLPGQCWNHAAIICLLLVMPKIKENHFVKLTYIFSILWFLLHGERVDVIGLLTVCLLFFSSKSISKFNFKSIKRYFKYVILIFVIITSMVYIGERRANIVDMNTDRILKKVLIQNTAADLAYVYNLSIKYPEDYGYLMGKSYANYIGEIIPFIKTNNTTELIITETYYSPGGAFLLSEPYMNFGVIGVILFAVVEMLLLNVILKRESKYSFYLYVFLIAANFRISWYGLNYIVTGLLYLLPILYLLGNMLDRRFKK